VKKILLISDTHGELIDDVQPYILNCDEVWHAGDLGTTEIENQIPKHITFRAVWGNIDGHILRRMYPEQVVFDVEGVKVAMIHIGGYPGRYTANGRNLVNEYLPDLFISGHSHILKISRDTRTRMLHMNPGSCGRKGFHTQRTAIRIQISNGVISEVEVIDLGPRGSL